MPSPSAPPDGTIKIEVHGGMCDIEFAFGWSTGEKGSDTDPGAFFKFTGYSPASYILNRYQNGEGVIARTDLARLRDAIDEFLKTHPAAPPDGSENE